MLISSLQWRHNERHGVSNHRRLDCLLKRLFRRRSKKTPKLRVAGLCEGNSPVSARWFPSQRASYTDMFPFDDVIMMYLNNIHALISSPPAHIMSSGYASGFLHCPLHGCDIQIVCSCRTVTPVPFRYSRQPSVVDGTKTSSAHAWQWYLPLHCSSQLNRYYWKRKEHLLPKE